MLKETEDYEVTLYEVIEVLEVDADHDSKADGDLLSPDGALSPKDIRNHNRAELGVAKDWVDIFRHSFADLVFSFQDCDPSPSILKNKLVYVVFRVIEIEVGLGLVHSWL